MSRTPATWYDGLGLTAEQEAIARAIDADQAPPLAVDPEWSPELQEIARRLDAGNKRMNDGFKMLRLASAIRDMPRTPWWKWWKW